VIGFGEACDVRLRSYAILIAIFFASTPIASGQYTSRGGPDPNKPAASDRVDESSPAPLPSLIAPLKQQSEADPYKAITTRQRVRWFLTSTMGTQNLAGGLFAAGVGTAFNRPVEYGPHWGGFADRYGMRMTGVVTGNAIEAGLGSLDGEDPRYFRVPDRPFMSRVGNTVRMAFVARRESGTVGPAYARYVAIGGNNFLSNTWRPYSEANTQDALLRTTEGFAGRIAANAFQEFWPDVRGLFSHKEH
jgi:hypothetical protein